MITVLLNAAATAR